SGGPHFPALPTPAQAAAPRPPGQGAGSRPRACRGESSRGLRLGPAPPPAAVAPRENGGGPGPRPGGSRRASAPRAGPGVGHSRGWAGRLPLRLRVVAVPVPVRRRLGLLARSPRRGSGARPLRCLPPAAAPSDGSRGGGGPGAPAVAAPLLLRSLGLLLLLRGSQLPSPSPSPGSAKTTASQAAPLPAPRSRPEPGFDLRTAQSPRARRRAAPQRPLRPRAPPGGRADSGRWNRARQNVVGSPRKTGAGVTSSSSICGSPALSCLGWRLHSLPGATYAHCQRPLPQLLIKLIFARGLELTLCGRVFHT
ncbi:PREDICTED: translation initiation factor IF-2-like, partial [Chinchilla lanigera]|uniref:translation initiation factor IF-2-like n=1 Tax=Chinchilla lanigera TaxID=34839 RepID=UPI000695A60D